MGFSGCVCVSSSFIYVIVLLYAPHGSSILWCWSTDIDIHNSSVLNCYRPGPSLRHHPLIEALHKKPIQKSTRTNLKILKWMFIERLRHSSNSDVFCVVQIRPLAMHYRTQNSLLYINSNTQKCVTLHGKYFRCAQSDQIKIKFIDYAQRKLCYEYLMMPLPSQDTWI